MAPGMLWAFNEWQLLLLLSSFYGWILNMAKNCTFIYLILTVYLFSWPTLLKFKEHFPHLLLLLDFQESSNFFALSHSWDVMQSKCSHFSINYYLNTPWLWYEMSSLSLFFRNYIHLSTRSCLKEGIKNVQAEEPFSFWFH